MGYDHVDDVLEMLLVVKGNQPLCNLLAKIRCQTKAIRPSIPKFLVDNFLLLVGHGCLILARSNMCLKKACVLFGIRKSNVIPRLPVEKDVVRREFLQNGPKDRRDVGTVGRNNHTMLAAPNRTEELDDAEDSLMPLNV